jgi:lipopolysaccharide transport protein LptA
MKYLLFISLFFIACVNAAVEKKVDNNTYINIEADDVIVMNNEGIAEFTKNVKVKKDEFTLYADKMIAYYDIKTNNVTKIIAINNVNFISPTSSANADKGIYDINKNNITLEGNVKTKEKNITVNSHRFIYDTINKKSNLIGDKDNKIKVVFD